VIRKHFGRATTIATAATLAIMLIGVGTVAAKTPGWTMDVVKTPPTVQANGNAGFLVTITNTGKSNMAQLYLTSDVAAAPLYTSPSKGSCGASGVLLCNLGALNSNASVTVLVVYGVGSSNFTVEFQANTTGQSGSDGGTSHGDTLRKQATTSVSSSQNFGGGFVVGSLDVSNFQTVGSGNHQSTKVSAPESLIPATVEDGITTGIACNATKCANAFGDWSVVNVNNGHVYGAAFKVTLMIWGGSVPNGATTSSIVLLHTLDNGTTTETVSTRCTPTTGTPTNAECITVTKVGNNFQIVAWLFKNGGIRGGF